MQVLTYSSLDEVEEPWHQYFPKNSLIGDYDLARYIEESLRKANKNLQVFVFKSQGSIVGILPLSYERRAEASFWSPYLTTIFTASEITIDPICWPHLSNILPRPFKLEESSWKSLEHVYRYKPLWVSTKPSNVIDLHADTSFESYFDSLGKKTKATFRNIINKNQDIDIVFDIPSSEDFSKIHAAYYAYCEKIYTQDMLCQLDLFPRIFEVALSLNKLIVLSFYLGNKLAASNYGILSDDGISFCDYICYRDTENEAITKRSIGIFAIIENIKHIRKSYPTCRWYDLASDFEYKRKFLNCEKSHIVFDLV